MWTQFIPEPPNWQPNASTGIASHAVTNDNWSNPGRDRVLSRVLNEPPARRYGVRVRFAVGDEAGEPVATATDYIETLDPDEDTRGKALVVSNRAHSAIIAGIAEQ